MKFEARLLLQLAFLLLPTWVHAAITCNVGSPGFFSVYDGLAATDNTNTSTFTVSCTRLSGDPATFNYIAFTDDGLYETGSNNKAKLSTGNSYIKYDFFTSAAYSTNWSKSNKCIIGSINFGTSLSGSQTQTYYAKIPAAQTGIPQGSYTDTVTINVAYNQSACQSNATVGTASSFQVQVSNVPSCQLAIPPGTLAFSYTAFSAAPATASTPFSARCSTTLPYTMALDANVGVVSGLNYSLALSAASGTGNGALQNYNINGTMAAGQAGTCASATCTATDPRVLTISY